MSEFHLVTQDIAANYAKEIVSMHHLRYVRCIRELQWPTNGIKVTETPHGNIEHDQFDWLDKTSYLMHVAPGGEVTACTRLAPTSERYLLREEFSHFVQHNHHLLNASTSLESSRFCVDRRAPRGMLPRLVATMIDHALAQGHTDIVALSYVKVRHLLEDMGWPSKPLGPERLTLPTGMSVAVQYPISHDVLAHIRKKNNLTARETIINATR